jgi:hypothetical protein
MITALDGDAPTATDEFRPIATSARSPTSS